MAILQASGALERLENFFYDMRCRHCQPATPPTDKLVQIDVDDEAISAIGRWPWPRTVLASIVDELQNAGAKTIGLDVLLADRQQPGTGDARQRGSVVAQGEADSVLEASLARSKNVVLPIAFVVGQPDASANQTDLVNILVEDMETSRQKANDRLRARGLSEVSADDFVTALHQAAALKIRDAGYPQSASLQQVRKKLLPRPDQFVVSTRGTRILEEELTRAVALQEIQQFGRPLEPGMEPPLHCRDEVLPLPELSAVAAGEGFVDFVVTTDGVIRKVPLWVEDHGRLFPQFGLALACSYLGVKPESLQFQRDTLVVPRAEGALAVPLVSLHVGDRSSAPLFIDVPFFGSSDWLTSYDYPRHHEPKQQINATTIWTLIETRRRIEDIDGQLDDAIAALMIRKFTAKQVDAYIQKPPPLDDFETRGKKVNDLLSDPFIRPLIQELESAPTEDRQNWSDEIKKLLGSAQFAGRACDENVGLCKQLSEGHTALAQAVTGKAVLMGLAATAAPDFRTTPLSAQCPGFAVHGMIFNAIITGQVWRQLPDWENVCIVAIVGILATIAVVWLPPWVALLAVVAFELIYLGFNGYVLFARMHYIAAAGGPVVAGAGVWAGLTLTRLMRVSAERAHILRRFTYYVDPELVKYVIEHPDSVRLEGEVREMSVVVTDLEGFGEISEQLRERTVELLNAYMNMMVPLIRAHGGCVNKFLGGGIMFFFGAPVACADHAVRAVDAVLEMESATDVFNQRHTRRGMPLLRMRAGISSGRMVVGDAGADTGSDYTVLGAPVQLCFQYERANKLFGTRMLIGDATLKQIESRYLVRRIGKLTVPNVRQPVMLYEPLCPVDKATDRDRRLAQLTAEVVDSYCSSDIKACMRHVGRLEEEFGKSPLALTYARLCSGDITQLSSQVLTPINIVR